jgi:hypothetical protein
VLSYETQREFIQRMSVAQDESFVLDPDGAGGAFRCLAVERTDRDNIVMK